MVLRKANTTAELGDQFALLVSGVVDYAIFMLDPAGRIVTWNEGAQRIKGYAAEEIIGRHFSVFYPAADTRIRKSRPCRDSAGSCSAAEADGGGRQLRQRRRVSR